MTSEMQERIARAIEAASIECDDTDAYYMAAALAVMKAMREPNTRMLAAAQTAWLNDPEKRTSTLWRAMLDAEISLAEGGSDD